MEYSIMFITAITPIHNGAGEGLGLIDRPIIRERMTNFPIIQASSIKGTLRDEYKFNMLANNPQKDTIVDALFGPMIDGSKHSGCVSFGDANILAFPVRSLKGCYVWATSPFILYRFWRAIELSGFTEKFLNLKGLIDDPSLHSEIEEVMINKSSKNKLLVNEKIILEEFPKSVRTLEKVGKLAEELAGIIFSASNSFIMNEFTAKLVVLPEDTFRFFVTFATEVVPNIKINDETGTSKEGLRYTEYLPSESILYSLVGFERAKSQEAKSVGLDNATAVKDLFIKNKPDRIQVGADETKGKGFVELSFLAKEV